MVHNYVQFTITNEIHILTFIIFFKGILVYMDEGQIGKTEFLHILYAFYIPISVK